MSDSDSPTPLHVHTLDTLCNELVSGRAVLIDDGAEEFRFSSLATRSIFDWYRRNRDRWAKNVMKTDVEALADQLAKHPPVMPMVRVPVAGQDRRVLHLKSMRAHRFAGIHRYGSLDQAPDVFEFEFERPLTLIEGMNGAGKTSLLSAITWCLTGHIYRSQRPPERVEEPLPVDVDDDSEQTDERKTANDITAITPLPPADVLKALQGTAVPLDTWVELLFVDDEGHKVGPIKRSLERSPRGKVKVVDPDLLRLGLAPVAVDVGTRMPGLIPYIQLGKPSDLGQAIAALTGIKPLQDLAKHAFKARDKLQRELVKDRHNEIAALDADYQRSMNELLALLHDHPQIAPATPTPAPSDERSIGRTLKMLTQHFEDQQARAYQDAESVLGASFDRTDRTARQDLQASVGPALGLLEPTNIDRLPSANRLRSLANVTDEQISEAEATIERLQEEARELAELAEKPDHATRLRLYARVAGWMKGLADHAHDLENCPVCQGTLEGKLDPVTQEPVRDHLERLMGVTTEYLEKTLTEWQKAAAEGLAGGVAEALAAETKRDLPDQPADLVAKALTEELFESDSLLSSLLPLQSAVQELCERWLGALPRFEEPELPDIPECLGGATGDVGCMLRRLKRAIASARWRQAHAESCVVAFRKIVGAVPRDSAARVTRPDAVEDWTLADRLTSLDEMVKRATPLKEALAKLQIMREKLTERRRKQRRIRLYGRTSRAIEPLLGLDGLVERQVVSLMGALSSETKAWKDRLYSPPFQGAPTVCKADVQSDGSLMLDATAGGSRASAHQISNASDLRATLLGFLLAFWKHLLDTRGGLSLLLLDDLQELFDAANRRRVAKALPEVIGSGGKLVVTSNDHSFGRDVSAAFARMSRSEDAERRYVHALGQVRPCIQLGVFRDSVQKKREDFEKLENENEHQPARDYVNELRVYIEARLLDFFEPCPTALSRRDTLSDMVAAIRTSRNAGVDPLTGPVFGDLVADSALARGSDFVELINKSHHGRAAEITYSDVKQVASDCKRVCRLIEAAHEAYERWLRRDPLQVVASLPVPPDVLTLPDRDVPVIEGLAAFTSEAGPSELRDENERFSVGVLESHAVYAIRSHNLGFSGPSGCRVLVRVSEEPPPDNSLVVALNRGHTHAGRLHRNDEKPELVIVGSEAEDPLKRPPSRFLPANETRLLQVVGVLFDFAPNYSRGSDDAVLESTSSVLDRIQIVLRVDRDSALPLAIQGQLILGGEFLSSTQLAQSEGTIVAIGTSDGSALKRVGLAIPGARHVRMFESVGGLGESMLIRTEDIEDDQFGGVPLLHSAREVLGVLYEVG